MLNLTGRNSRNTVCHSIRPVALGAGRRAPGRQWARLSATGDVRA